MTPLRKSSCLRANINNKHCKFWLIQFLNRTHQKELESTKNQIYNEVQIAHFNEMRAVAEQLHNTRNAYEELEGQYLSGMNGTDNIIFNNQEYQIKCDKMQTEYDLLAHQYKKIENVSQIV
jgi:hypothetical protein